MRKALFPVAALLLGSLVAACGDDDGSPQPALAPNYTLVSIDGDPLPASPGGGETRQVVSGSLSFQADSTAVLLTDLNDEAPAIRSTTRYRMVGGQVLIWNPASPQDTARGRVIGRDLTLDMPTSGTADARWVYRANQ